MKKADLHIHSNFSDGISSPEQIVDYVVENKLADKIYITDHNEIDGAFSALGYTSSRGYKLEVGIGSEISTNSCHILGLDLKKKVKKYMSVTDTMYEILSQGGFPVIAHPFNPFNLKGNHAGGMAVIEEAISSGYPFALEINGSLNYFTALYHKGIIFPKITCLATYNKRVMDIVEKLNLPIVGASDAHTKSAICSAYTSYNHDLIPDIRVKKSNYGLNSKSISTAIPYLMYHLLFDIFPMKYKRFLISKFTNLSKNYFQK